MMKLKSNQTRTYDGDGYKKRAACLCFRSESEEEYNQVVCGDAFRSAEPRQPVVKWSFPTHALGKVVTKSQTDTHQSGLRSQVLLVSSSRHPDRWIVPGGGMEPEEEPNVAAVREVCEELFTQSRFRKDITKQIKAIDDLYGEGPTGTGDCCLQILLPACNTAPAFLVTRQSFKHIKSQAGVKGTLGRLVGIFENRDRKHRTYVYVLIVTEVLEDWEDSVNIGRKREWFKIEDAIKVLQYHKPVQASYFETLRQGCLANNGTPVMTTTYSESSVSDIR